MSGLTGTDNLRSRLLVLRRDALRQLAEADTLDTGLLALAADATTVLAALDAEAEPAPDLSR